MAEALSSGREINKILIRKGLRSELFSQLFQRIREHGIPYQFVPVEKLNALTKGNHQGVVAQLALIEYKELEEIIQRTFEAGRDPFVLILDRVTDVRNFGAIARTAECAGVDILVVPEKESVAITADAIRTSAGALSRVAVARRKNLNETLTYLKECGIRIAAVTEKAEKLFYDDDLSGPVALLLGAEDRGISPALIQMSDLQLKIPLKGNIASLNVSVALGIVAYEVVRQRGEMNK